MAFLIYLFDILCVLLVGEAAVECSAGLCRHEFPLNETCDIPADTRCDIKVYCNNDGECFHDQFTYTKTCVCSGRRQGANCEQDYPRTYPCTDDSECLPGWCVSVNDERHYCICPKGLSGNRCEKIARSYLSENWACPCGKMYIQGRTLGCSCPCGLIGQYCERVHWNADYQPSWDHCQNFDLPKESPCPNITKVHLPPCRNGGTCYVDNVEAMYKCRCRCGYYGDFCEYSALTGGPNYKDPCLGNNLNCQNGGTCYYDTTTCTTRCKCKRYYGGDDCRKKCRVLSGCSDDAEDAPLNRPNTPEVMKNVQSFLPLMWAGGISLLIVFACFTWRMRRAKSPCTGFPRAPRSLTRNTTGLTSGLTSFVSLSSQDEDSRTQPCSSLLNNSSGVFSSDSRFTRNGDTSTCTSLQQERRGSESSALTKPSEAPPSYKYATIEPPTYADFVEGRLVDD